MVHLSSHVEQDCIYELNAHEHHYKVINTTGKLSILFRSQRAWLLWCYFYEEVHQFLVKILYWQCKSPALY